MGSSSFRPETGSIASALLRRTLEGLLTAWAAVSVAFFSLRLGAGDPINSLLAQGLATKEQAQALSHELGLDAPLLLQYVRFLGGLLRGDLGKSLYTGRNVGTVIAEQLGYTLQLALVGFLLALLIGFALGLLAALRDRTNAGLFAEGVAGLAMALPVTFTGILAILVFGLAGNLLTGIWGAGSLQRLALPGLVLGFASSGPIARATHAGLRQSLQAPYTLAARARGLGHGWRFLWNTLRPTLPPILAMAGLQAGFLLAGTVVTETIFSRPGLGRLLISSILQGDYSLAQGVVVLAALFYSATHLLADILSMVADVRLREAS
jgi:peptide/nickel transport system permease protein